MEGGTFRQRKGFRDRKAGTGDLGADMGGFQLSKGLVLGD